MELLRGMVVKSMAGHDSGSFYVAISVDKDFAMIADGKLRTVKKPKKKNIKHLAGTKIVFAPDEFETNKQLRHILWPYNYGNEMPVPSKREVK